MIRSYYSATSGALTESRNLGMISNNISNISTAGFKREIPLSSSFRNMVLTRVAPNDSGEIGSNDLIRTTVAPATDYGQGGFDETGRALDFAIEGDGYFNVLADNGTTYLTRNGECYMNEEGFLAHTRGGLLLDKSNEPIMLGNTNFEVDDQGNIYLEDREEPISIGVTAVTNPTQLIKVNEGFFLNNAPGNTAPMAIANIAWKTLERSNVDITEEMTKSIASSRNFQSCTQVMKMIDDLNQKTVNEIARL